MKTKFLLLILALLGFVSSARAQLNWSSYNTSGSRVSANAATYNSTTNTYTVTIPASTSYTFVTTGFVPVTLAANQAKTVAFTMNSSGGFGAAGSPVQNQRFIAYGLFNFGATAPGATGQFTDDLGLWTDSYQQSSGIAAEVFGGTSTTANLLGYAGATQLGAGTGPSSGAAGQFTNSSATDVTFRVVMNSAGTSSSIGTGTATDAAGAWYKDNATGGTTFNRTIYSSATSTVAGNVTFNEFGFLFYNSTSSPVTLTLANFSGLTPVITTQPTNVLAAPGSNATFTVGAVSGVAFQWQSSSDGGTTFTNIDTAANASAATASLTLTNVQTSTASVYRVLATPTGGAATASNSARLVVPSTSNTTATPQVNVAIRSTVRSGITVTGAAAIGTAGSVWNNLTGAAPSGALMSQDYLSNAALVSDSGAATSVALTLNATSPDHTQSAVMHAFNDGTTYPTVTPIMNYYTYYWWTSKLTLTLTGLRPGTSYDLYGYGTGNANTQGSLWTLDNANGGASAACLADFTSSYTRDVTNTANQGHSYVKLSGTADNSGTLKVVVDHSATSGDPYFNGFQFAETPQTTITSQPANTTTTVGASAFLSITAPTGQSFLWQRSTDGGSTWTTLSPSANASAATASLALTNCQTSDAGLYRALVLNTAGALIVSSSATLSVVPNGGSTADTAVNVAFRANSQSGAPAVTGAAAAGSAGSVWNNLVGATPSSSLLTQALVSSAALVDDSGAATSKTTTITVTAGSNSVSASQHTFNDGTTYSPIAIMNYYTYWWWSAYLTVNVTGLKPNGLYYVYGYGTGNGAGQGSKWIVDAANGGASAEAPADFGSGYTRDVTNVANLNHSYVKLSATATASGTLTFVINHATGQNDPYVNGFQVVPQAIPTITAQPPANSTATLLGNFSMGVTATGPGTLSYQWQKSTDGGATFSNISGASNVSAVTATLSISNVQASDAGTYRVLVTNAAGTVVSSNAVVTTQSGQVAPTIQSQPTSSTVLAGASASFTVGASGTSPLSYQWQKSTDGGSTFSNLGADSAALSFASATLADTGLYRVTVTNSIGSVTSNAVTLTVNQAPVINTQPVAATIASGANYTLSVAVTAAPSPTYQWKLNGANISGATSASYTISNATGANAGLYSCVVTNSIGSVTSNAVYVGVLSSTMTLSSVGPTNGATGRNRDTLLKITFNQSVSVGSSGRIRVYDASAPSTPMDTIDMSTAHLVNTTSGSTVLASGSYMQKTIGGLIFDYQPVIASGNTATIALHSSTALSYGKTYYVTIEPGVLLDATGATFAGISDNTAWTFSTKASGPAANAPNISVASDGSGDFDTVQGAIDFVPYSPANTIARTITVKNGTYTEYVHFRSGQNLVTLKGESQSGVVIQYLVNNFVLSDLPNQNTLDPRGVFSCSTNDVTLQNLAIKNQTPNGGSQAEALVHGGQRFIVNHVSLYSYQDTLLAGGGTAFYTDSYIEGAVDYIWGGAQAFFQRCELKANTNNTYYTQARNAQTAKGYAFVNCTLDAYPSVSAATSSLSRTFFDYSQTIYIHCKMGPHVRPQGWSVVSGNTDTLQLWEFENTDLNGAPLDVSQRPTYNHSFSVSGTSIVYTSGASSSPDVFDHQQVSAAMAAPFSTPSAFFGTWTPSIAPTFDTQPVAVQTIVVGQSATFIVAATGFPDPTYQWQKNGVPISGATSASYTIPAATVSNSGTYTVVATNSAGSTTSNAASLTVNDVTPPTISGTFTSLSLATGSGGTVALPNYLAQATITDDVGVIASSQSPVAGTNVGVGTTHVTLTASDAAGNVATTIFDVIVSDGTPPTISGTFTPLTLTTGAGGTVTLPNYVSQAVTSDNVGVTSVVQSPAAGAVLNAGVTDVTLTASDAAGNSASTSFDVTVLDGTAPTIGGTFTPLTLATGAGGTVPLSNYAAQAVTSDNVGVTSVVQSPAVGSARGVGISHVTLTASDAAGNSASTSFDVTVTDGTAPTIAAPSGGFSPLTLTTGVSGAVALPDYTAQAVTSDEVGVTRVTQSPEAGSVQNAGTTHVTVTAHDAVGNVASVSFDVTVLDGTAPVIVGPLGGFTPLNIDTGSADTAAIPDYTTQASASDNVAVVGDITQAPVAGTVKTVGPVTVTLRATDAVGNVGTLDLIVNLNDGTLPVITTLPADRTLAAGADGTVVLPNLTSEVVATDNVAVTSITQNPPAGTSLNLGVTNVTITVRDAAINAASGIVHIAVTDQSVPVVHAPAGGFTPVTLASGVGGMVVLPDYAAQATATDNVGVVGAITQSPAAGSAQGVGTTAVTLSAQDAAGNVGTLSFNLIVTDGTVPTISGAFTPLTIATGGGGTVTLGDYTAQAVTSDNVGVTSVTQSPAVGAAQSVGTTHVTLTASDEAGNTANTSFDVIVTDGTAPTISGTFTPLTIATGAGGTVALGDYTLQATVSDNVAVSSVTQDPVAGTARSVGTTHVTLTAFDAAGNSVNSSFDVIVNDGTAPSVTPPSNVTVSTTNPAGANVSYGSASASDNVAVTSLTYSQASGSLFPVGTTIVNVTAQDAAGNTGSASFSVTVSFSGTPGTLSFATNAVSANPLNTSGALSVVPVMITRTGGTSGAVSVEVTASATGTAGAVVGGFKNYTYGTEYQFVSESAPGKALASFADGQSSATVSVQLKTAATTAKGKFNLTLGTATGAPTQATVTINAKDGVLPVLTVTSPTTSAPGASFNVTGTVKEDAGLSSFSVKLNGVAQTLTANPMTSFAANTNVSFSALGVVLENGTNTLVIEAVDMMGNKASVTKTLTYTNTRSVLAGTYAAVLAPSGTPDNDRTGLVTVTVSANGSFTGKATIGGLSASFAGVVQNNGAARFTPSLKTALDLTDATEFPSYLGALAFSVDATTGLTGTLSTQASGGTVLANFTGKAAPYTATNRVPPGLLNLPISGTPTSGRYTVAFPSKTQSPALAANAHPQGDGYAMLTMTSTGAVALAGFLADGTAYSASGKLRADGTVPLFTQLYRKRGGFTTELKFEGLTDTDVSGANSLWVRPTAARARYYAGGWPNGLRVDAIGAKYANSVNFGQGAVNATLGNAMLNFTAGQLTSAQSKVVSINSTTGAATLIPATAKDYTFALAASTGVFSGVFTHTDTTRAGYKGVLVNKGANTRGFGFFTSIAPDTYTTGGEGGRVALVSGGLSTPPTTPTPPSDALAPTIAITAPTTSSVTGDFALTGTVKENVALASFSVKLNGVTLALSTDPRSGFVANNARSWSVANISPENGTNTIVIEAADAAGNKATTTKTLTYVNNRPALVGTYSARLTAVGSSNVNKTGLLTVTVTTTGAFTGKVVLGEATVSISGVLANDGTARFKPGDKASIALTDATEFPSYLGALLFSIDAVNGLTGTLSTEGSGGTTLANFSGKAAPYTSTNLVPSNLLNQTTKGVYNVAFPSQAQTPALDSSLYPQGSGYAVLTLTNSGNITLAGYLADGTLYSTSTKLRSDGTAPIFTQLYRKRGGFTGELVFATTSSDTDVTAPGCVWVRPAQPLARYYPAGWESGLTIDAIGTAYARPASLNFGQGSADPNGNASLVFAAGALTSTQTKPVSIDPTSGAVKLVPATTTACTLSLTAGTGVFSGIFTHTDTTKPAYKGILLNKGTNQGGFGYFLSTPPTIVGASGQSGGVSLEP